MPEDVAFSLYFVRDCGTGVAWNYASVMDVDHIDTKAEDPDLGDWDIKVYFTVKSAWALHWAGLMPIINKDLWMTAIGPGTPAGYDPDAHTFVNAMKVREYHQWEQDANGNDIIDLIEDGTGPWIFVGADTLLTEWIELDANRDFYKTQTEISDYLAEAFHGVGDVNADGKIGIVDLGLIARALGTNSATGGTPGDWDAWNPAADLNKDDQVNLSDLMIAGKNYGKVSG